MEDFDSVLEELANEVEDHGYNDLAVLLYTYLGAKKSGMTKQLSKHVQGFAKREKRRLKQIDKGNKGYNWWVKAECY